MTTPRLLYRIDGAGDSPPLALETIQEGVRRHLQRADLLSILVQIGRRQQAYVALHGCPGCLSGRCRIGCKVDLLRRTLQGDGGPGWRLALVRNGLSRRPYRQLVALWPTPAAQPLSALALRHWPEARLTIHWAGGRARPEIAVAALLATGAGPAVAAVLRAAGWRTLPLPRLSGPILNRPQPAGLPLRLRWPTAPTLLLPQAEPEPPAGMPAQAEAAPAPDPEEELARQLAEWLKAVREQRPPPGRPQPQPPDRPRDADAPQPAPAPAHHAAQPPADDAGPGDVPAPLPTPEPAATPSPVPAPAGEPPPEARGAPEGPADTIPWPAGPGTMGPTDVAQLIVCCGTSPVFVGGERPGITKKRLGAVLPVELAEHAAALTVWLGRAGALADPPVPDEPWRNPRPLATDDRAAIAARLAATPIPSAAEAHAALREQR